MDKLITRRASKGFNREDSAVMLADLIASHTGDSLAFALVYNEFATEAGAHRFAAAQG